MAEFKEESRKSWSRDPQGPTTDDLKLGCLQRIASATEMMANEYNRLLRDANWQRERKEELQRVNDRLARSNAALRGVIKRMKKGTQP